MNRRVNALMVAGFSLTALHALPPVRAQGNIAAKPAAKSSASPAVAAESPESLVENFRWKRARALLEPRVKQNPSDAQAAYLLSKVRQAYGDLDGAQPLAEKAVQLDAGNAEYHYQLSSVYGQKAERASIFTQASWAGKFRREAETAMRLGPNHIDSRMAIMEFYYRAPGFMGGDKQKARALPGEIGRIDAARGILAEVHLARLEKKTLPLTEFYEKAVAADPRNYDALISLAGVYAGDAQKKYDAAKKHSREAIRTAPGRVRAYSLLAQVDVLTEDWKELDSTLAQSEKNIPDNLSPYYHAGRMLASQGKDLSLAENYLKKHLTQEPEPNAPDHALTYFWLGKVYDKQGRRADARTAFETASRLKPDLKEAREEARRLR